MKTQRLIPAIISVVLTSLALEAAPLYWDAGGTSGVSLGGTGNWDTSSALWFNGVADIAWTNANNDDAYFTGTAGTVTLTEDINAGSLFFTNATGSYLITTNATGGENLAVGRNIDIGSGDHVIAVPIVNSTTLTKTGEGRLHLTADNGTTLTGNVAVNNGVISIENNNALGTNGMVTVANGAAVEVNGGTNGLADILTPIIINGAGITNGGVIRNVSGRNTWNGAVGFDSTNVILSVDTGLLGFEGSMSVSNVTDADVTFIGGGEFHISYYNTSEPFNIGTGSLTVSDHGYVNDEAKANVYSNLVVANGSQYSFGTHDAGLGAAPSTFQSNNITLDGGYLNYSHTFTMNANRGIYLGTNITAYGHPGGVFVENTTGGYCTIPGTISGPGDLESAQGRTGSYLKLDGSNTYSGLTIIDANAGLMIGNAGTSGTLGTGDVIDNGTLTFNRGDMISYVSNITGSGKIIVNGAAITTLSGDNSYTGGTTVNAYMLLVDNTAGSGLGTGPVEVQAGTLGGTGAISGSVQIDSSGILQPGDASLFSVGDITISNSLTLLSGSTTIIEMDASVPATSEVSGLTSVTYGGALMVDNLAGNFTAGETFKLFDAASYSGVFDGGISLPPLPAGLNWDTSNLAVNGTVSVTGTEFNPPVLSGTNIVLSGTAGSGNAGYSYSVLVSTNVALPVSNWTVLSTGNTFDSNGNFDFTNGIDPNSPQQFFMIRVP